MDQAEAEEVIEEEEEEGEREGAGKTAEKKEEGEEEALKIMVHTFILTMDNGRAFQTNALQ